MRNAFAVMYCPYSDGAGSQTCPLKIKQQTYTHTDTGWNAKTHRKPNRHIVCASRRRCDTLIIISSAGGWRESSRGTRVWRDGAFFTPFLIRPHEPYFSEDNSNTFKVRMCIPELKRAKSTIPLECIRDSSTLACLKKNTLAQLFLFCPSLMANAFSLNGFHNKRCG